MPKLLFWDSESDVLDWWPLAVGFLILFIPTFYSLATGLWANEDQAHGPIILLLSLWLIGRRWSSMLIISDKQSNSNFGWIVFFLAC